jgi:hypothetical protein
MVPENGGSSAGRVGMERVGSRICIEDEHGGGSSAGRVRRSRSSAAGIGSV